MQRIAPVLAVVALNHDHVRIVRHVTSAKHCNIVFPPLLTVRLVTIATEVHPVRGIVYIVFLLHDAQMCSLRSRDYRSKMR